MRADEHHHRSARLGNPDVQRGGHADAPRVVQQADARIARCVLGDDRAGPVVAHAVNHEDLPLRGGVVVHEQRPEAFPDTLPLIAAGDDERNHRLGVHPYDGKRWRPW